MRRLAIVVLAVGCTEHGSRPDPSSDPSFETPRFQPLVCTGGMPGDPTCPVNVIDLEATGAPAKLSFVLQLLDSGMFLSGVSLVAGDEGVTLENLTLRMWTSETVPMELPFDVAIELRPGEALAIGSRAIVIEDTTRPLSLRATSAGPFR